MLNTRTVTVSPKAFNDLEPGLYEQFDVVIIRPAEEVKRLMMEKHTEPGTRHFFTDTYGYSSTLYKNSPEEPAEELCTGRLAGNFAMFIPHGAHRPAPGVKFFAFDTRPDMVVDCPPQKANIKHEQ